MTSISSRKSGFTLIEVLASSAVLVIMVLMLGRFFRDSSFAWESGTRKATDSTLARGVMDFIVRDCSLAVADDKLSFFLDSAATNIYGTGTYAWQSDSLNFISLSEEANTSDATSDRNAREVRYMIREMLATNGTPIKGRYRLTRGYRTTAASSQAYVTNRWWDVGTFKWETVAENVGRFEVYCWGATTSSSGMVYADIPFYNSQNATDLHATPSDAVKFKDYELNKAPVWIDIMLTMLSEEDSIKAATLLAPGGVSASQSAQSYVERNGKRYLARVNLLNREGYLQGP